MNVSIDEHTADEHESVRNVLAGWLDDFRAGRCDRSDMEDAFLSVCGSDPEAPWEALSLLDRYQRLGRVDPAVARHLKVKISQLAVGASGGQASQRSPAAPLGSAEQDAESLRTHDIEVPPAVRERPSLRDAEEEDDEEDDEGDEVRGDEVAPHRAPAASVRAHEASASLREPSSDPSVVHAFSAAPSASRRRVLRGRYELLSVLAEGQTSTVYKALDRHRANLAESARYVAVKVYHARFEAHSEALAQLEQGFHLAQSLSHPNIAKVFDLDRDGDTYFVVMELLEGESLASVLRRLQGQPMSRENALVVIGAIGAALAYAHRKGVAHGDLKPRNIMITASGEVRVLGFGFARARGAYGAAHEGPYSAVTTGTQAYASAERLHGLDPDPSDDVYSLACIGYELLSGRHPYGGRAAIQARAQGRRPARPRGLTRKQWHALSRALAWDQADRKVGVGDLLAALGISQETGHTPVPPELLAIPENVYAQRLRRFAAVLVVVAVVVGGAYLVTRIPPPPQRVGVASVAPAPAAEETDAPAAETDTPDGGTLPHEERAQPSALPQAQQPPRQEPIAAGHSATQARAQPQEERTSDVGVGETAAPAQASTRAEAARPATIELSRETYTVFENDVAASVEVRRTGSASNSLRFRWSLRGVSAEAGSDFADIGPGIEEIPSGARTATILIPLVNDSIAESTELFMIEIEPLDEGVEIGRIGEAAVIIVDDD